MKIKNIFAILAFVFAIATTSTAFAQGQGARNLGYEQTQKCGHGSKDPKCLGSSESDADRVWQLTGASPQDFDIPRKLESGLEIHYSKDALRLMASWEIEESEDLDYLDLTRITDDNLASNLVFEGKSTRLPNRAVYVVRLDRKTNRGVVMELRIVMFEKRGTVSQVRIFDGGRAYQEVVTAGRKK